MAVTDALTFNALVIFSFLSLISSFILPPEFAAIFLALSYYFIIFHIAHVVGESRGWYRDALPTYFILLIITIVDFSAIYYRYGLLVNGARYEPSILEAIYFSVTTWTTLGYGDFAPSVRVRHITSVQATLGYIGMGLWIALISAFIKNMADNRQRVRMHNDALYAKSEAQQEAAENTNGDN